MAVNKVDVNGATVLDLTQDSVTPETLKKGETAHDASGALIVGTMETVMIPKTTALLKGDGAIGVSAYINNTKLAVSAYISGSYCYYSVCNVSTSSQSGTIYFTFTTAT